MATLPNTLAIMGTSDMVTGQSPIGSDGRDATESTPLLGSASDRCEPPKDYGSSPEPSPTPTITLFPEPKPAATPLPKRQLSIILFLRVTEPISYLVCFPFINQMLLDIGVVDDPSRAGFYAGLVSPSYPRGP